MSTITQEYAEKIRASAAKIDAALPRAIWIEGSGRVFCDGPGNVVNRELNKLDLIRMIHDAKQETERIIALT